MNNRSQPTVKVNTGMASVWAGFFLIAGATAPAALGQQITGTWSSNKGQIQLNGYGRNNYGGPYGSNGHLWGSVNGASFDGHWVRTDNLRSCHYPINGSYNWGRVQLQFYGNRFSGQYGVCNEYPNRYWSGNRQIVGSSPTDILAPLFSPNLKSIYSSSWGTINWEQGWYGNPSRSIRVTRKRWDPQIRKHVVEGTWNQNNGIWGYFLFQFRNPCQFDGIYWRHNSPRNQSGWDGRCMTGTGIMPI